jgi:hypothetical protein
MNDKEDVREMKMGVWNATKTTSWSRRATENHLLYPSLPSLLEAMKPSMMKRTIDAKKLTMCMKSWMIELLTMPQQIFAPKLYQREGLRERIFSGGAEGKKPTIPTRR